VAQAAGQLGDAGIAVAVPAVLTVVLGIAPGLVSGPIQQAAVLRW
jgi:hypothetical protein